MLHPTWSTSSLPKRCNQDPQFASSVAAGGPSDDIYLFIFWVPSLPAGGPCADNGSLLLQSFIMVIVI